MSYVIFNGGRREAQPASIVFTHGLIFGFFTPEGRHGAPIKEKFGREDGPFLPVKFHLDRLRVMGLRPQKLLENLEFYE